MEHKQEEYHTLHEQIFLSRMRLKRFRWDKLQTAMNSTEFQILGILEEHKQKHPEQIGVYASVLSDLLEVSRPAISKQLQPMEEQGWIRRVTDPKSRRNTYVQMLPEGEKIFLAQRERVFSFWNRVCERAGTDQVRQMIESLNIILDAAQEELDKMKNDKEETSK